MSAELQIYKYSGKDGTFGTPVTGIGIKRIDAVVPAVYQSTSSGGTVTPSDDKSDANTYCIYRPDDPDATAYSFESVFKLVLKAPPSNQLSHIRLYPEGEKPNDPNLPILYVGNSKSYSRPTNAPPLGCESEGPTSTVAKDSIWNYSKESPFLLTVNGNYGQYVDERLSVLNYNITMHDIGVGNLIYLNNERQIDVPIVLKKQSTDPDYQFIDKTNGAIVFTLFDAVTNVPVVSSDVIVSTVAGQRIVTVKATQALLTAYPNGFRYGDVNNINIGYTITWVDLTAVPATIEEYTVEVRTLSSGAKAYYLNGMKNPILNFEENKIYKFYNLNGDTDPIRFLNNNKSVIANVEREIVINGVTVVNGGTINEVVTIDPVIVSQSGSIILGYQSVFNVGYGNPITNIRTCKVGNYNLDTVNGGIHNPLHAGETDYVYLQLGVKGNSTVGQVVPNIIIEYDES